MAAQIQLDQVLSHLSNNDRQELQQFLNKEQRKAAHHASINAYTDVCWDKCITKVRDSIDYESQCISNCVDRFLDSAVFLTKQFQSDQNDPTE